MKKTCILLTLALSAGILLGGCGGEPAPIMELKPLAVERVDLDNDGRPELVLAFDRKEFDRLGSDSVVVRGRFPDAMTVFETESFSVTR